MDRKDGWDGDVRVDVSDVPAGFYVTTPIVVEAGHLTSVGSIYALPEAKQGAADFSKTKLIATAMINGKETTRPVTGLEPITVTAPRSS
ncbi:MAG: hypothetical protein WDN28_04645 [Chthoniobacter sp.]